MPDQVKYYIYFLRRPDKDDLFEPGRSQPFYVGKGSNGRHLSHRMEALEYINEGFTYNKYKSNIILSLWRRGLDFEEEIILDNLTEKEAFEYEREAIATYGRKNNGTGILSNMTNGGEGSSGLIWSEESRRRIGQIGLGRKHREETKQKIGNGNRGIKHSELSRRNMSEAHIGYITSEETKRKLSMANKGKTISEEHKKRLSQFQTGRKHTEESKRKMSRKHKGKILSESHRRNIGLTQIGKIWSDETKRKISEKAKIRERRKRWDKIIQQNFLNLNNL